VDREAELLDEPAVTDRETNSGDDVGDAGIGAIGD
jgi:hypothetical protein